MTSDVARHDFPSPAALAEALARRVAQQLSAAIAERGKASLAVSGGKTPVRFFQALSAQELDWSSVTVTLVDERLVPETDERSNARLVRQHLLQGSASAATFVPLYSQAASHEAAARFAGQKVDDLGKPLDAVILGMGGDGHTASFFPDAANLAALFANAECASVLPVMAQSAGEPRLTLSAQLLGSARFVALHIEGGEKRAVLDDALKSGTKPVATMIAMASTPVEVFWAP